MKKHILGKAPGTGFAGTTPGFAGNLMNMSVSQIDNLIATVAGAEGLVFYQSDPSIPAAIISSQYLGSLEIPTIPTDDFWGCANPASLVWVASIDGVISPPFFQIDHLLFWVKSYLDHRASVWSEIEESFNV